ncbi:polyadenylate-binding protein-interacting protein 3 isoform X3 [Neltuma alba]|uniref:polyadenylate-binding protein-interacting protein 3 isoform X3 n=1 Tax=Neltuma alba TaxID=207710 RepID=UPI0010A4C7A1|nr:polyadenylate-binding protein-interacting protein 3-like isoform X3 [Prosopis alba]
MNMQQVGQSRSCNGYGRRKSEREGAAKSENKISSGKSNANRLASTVTGNIGDGPSHDRVVYVTTCLIGQQVEVHVKNGSIYSGIFHATNAEKDFGIILKMARMTKDGSLRGQKSGIESVCKAPSKTLIIPGKEFVQVIAKGVAVTRDGLLSEAHHEMYQDITVDSVISQSRHVDLERELQPWVPDEDDPQCPELENIFDETWKRGWDQFETNKTLFGVKSTFNEELYTTKLEKGPQTRELEKQALRIAREIEGEDTQDLHLAEERGLYLHKNFDIDEETRFSSVYRDKGVYDSGYDENEDILSDSRNSETFGDTVASVVMRSSESSDGKDDDGVRTPSNSSSKDLPQSSQSSNGVDLGRAGSHNLANHLASELPAKSDPTSDAECRFLVQGNSHNDLHGAIDSSKGENQIEPGDVEPSKSKDLQSSHNLKKNDPDTGALSSNEASRAPSSHISSKTSEKTGLPGDLIDGSASEEGKGETNSLKSFGITASSTSTRTDCVKGVAASPGPGLSPSSSVGSLSSEKSTLNPNAKEFKLNPNAKSFVPSPSPVRSLSQVSDGSFYYPTNVTTVPHMPAMPMELGMGHAFAGPQPVVYNPQVAQMSSQAYFHPNGSQYGQLLGHPRQVLYMPGYLPETPYKGRDY